MDEEKYQKELFEFEKPKRSFPRLAGFFPKADFEGKFSITLTLERLIFLLIGIIMLMVIIYALGVEVGRSVTNGRAVVASAENRPVPVKALPPQTIKPIPQATMPVPAKPITVKPVDSSNKPYTIVAVTFSSKEGASQEVSRLKKEGYDAFLVQSDPYFQVCIGSYSDKNGTENQKELKKIKRVYKDAYFRLK